jgi:hypothetical protein
MTHVTEQDLVLHYYGELAATDDRAITAHLTECAGCRHEFTRLQRVLGAIDEAAIAPELPDGFERTVWARLEPGLRRDKRGWLSWLAPAPLALAAMVLLLVGAAFFAGRMSSPAVTPSTTAANPAEQVRERILLVDLGEHLDRSQMVLVELVSGDQQGGVDVSGDRARAEQLLAANRLYRQTAAATGDATVGELLDELERVLVEIVASPERASGQGLDDVRKQIDAGGLLFRVRIVSSEVRERQKEGIQRRTGQRL